MRLKTKASIPTKNPYKMLGGILLRDTISTFIPSIFTAFLLPILFLLSLPASLSLWDLALFARP